MDLVLFVVLLGPCYAAVPAPLEESAFSTENRCGVLQSPREVDAQGIGNTAGQMVVSLIQRAFFHEGRLLTLNEDHVRAVPPEVVAEKTAANGKWLPMMRPAWAGQEGHMPGPTGREDGNTTGPDGKQDGITPEHGNEEKGGSASDGKDVNIKSKGSPQSIGKDFKANSKDSPESTDKDLKANSKDSPASKGDDNETANPYSSMMVPVPIIPHKLARSTGTPLSRLWGTDLLGDPLAPTDQGRHTKLREEPPCFGHKIPWLTLLAVLVGGVVRVILQRYTSQVSYMTMLVFLGFVISRLLIYIDTDNKEIVGGCQMNERWFNADRRVLFYGVLPVLLFGRALRLRVQPYARCFFQAILMGCPGTLVSTLVLAAIIFNLLPFSWDWPIVMLLSCLLAAPDTEIPITILNDVGASPRLIALLQGEYLTATVVASVLFGLFSKWTLGAQVDAWAVTAYMANNVGVALTIGLLSGLVAQALLGVGAQEPGRFDAVLQAMASFGLAVVIFCIAEAWFSASGAMTVIVAGLFIADKVWQRLGHRDTFGAAWGAIEFVATTVLFVLAGLILGDLVGAGSSVLGLVDLGRAALLGVVVVLARALSLALLWFPLNKVGMKMRRKEGVAVLWGGPRGSPALLLALISYLDPNLDTVKEHLSSRLLFYVVVVTVFLSLIESAMSFWLLRRLAILETEAWKAPTIKRIQARVHELAKEMLSSELLDSDVRVQGAGREALRELQTQAKLIEQEDSRLFRGGPGSMGPELTNGARDAIRAQAYREAFLKHVQAQYWVAIDRGFIPRRSEAARMLINSVDFGLDSAWYCLDDWRYIERQAFHWSWLRQQLVAWATRLPLRLMPGARAWAHAKEVQDVDAVYAALSFIHAHTLAQQDVPSFHGAGGAAGAEELVAAVNFESLDQVGAAQDDLHRMPPKLVSLVRSRLAELRSLHAQLDQYGDLQEKGLLSPVDRWRLQGQVMARIRDLADSVAADWAGP